MKKIVAMSIGLICLCPVLFAQVNAPLQIGAFGGITKPLTPIAVPNELTSFVPNNSVLRAVLHTKIAEGGETVFLYDNGDEVGPYIHLYALRHGRAELLLEDGVSAVAGMQVFQNGSGGDLLAFAYHQGGDQADTTFIFFSFKNGSYRRLFKHTVSVGTLRILNESPLTLQSWSAEWKLDPAESCVWCKHRYHVRTYVWRHQNFELTSERITKQFLQTSEIATVPFAISKSKTTD